MLPDANKYIHTRCIVFSYGLQYIHAADSTQARNMTLANLSRPRRKQNNSSQRSRAENVETAFGTSDYLDIDSAALGRGPAGRIPRSSRAQSARAADRCGFCGYFKS